MRRDPEAFAEFYDRHALAILRFCARRVLSPDAAFDIQAETFAIALEQAHQFRGNSPEEEQAWLFAIARSQLSRSWKQTTVDREVGERLGIAQISLSDDDYDRIERLADLDRVRDRLAHATRQLPPDQRRAVELRVIEELDYAEIARQEATTEQAIRTRVSRGLKALAAILEAAGLNED